MTPEEIDRYRVRLNQAIHEIDHDSYWDLKDKWVAVRTTLDRYDGRPQAVVGYIAGAAALELGLTVWIATSDPGDLAAVDPKYLPAITTFLESLPKR